MFEDTSFASIKMLFFSIGSSIHQHEAPFVHLLSLRLLIILLYNKEKWSGMSERRSLGSGARAGAPLLFKFWSGSGSAATFFGWERERERRSIRPERCPTLYIYIYIYICIYIYTQQTTNVVTTLFQRRNDEHTLSQLIERWNSHHISTSKSWVIIELNTMFRHCIKVEMSTWLQRWVIDVNSM